jgi:hypothetical protein
LPLAALPESFTPLLQPERTSAAANAREAIKERRLLLNLINPPWELMFAQAYALVSEIQEKKAR